MKFPVNCTTSQPLILLMNRLPSNCVFEMDSLFCVVAFQRHCDNHPEIIGGDEERSPSSYENLQNIA